MAEPAEVNSGLENEAIPLAAQIETELVFRGGHRRAVFADFEILGVFQAAYNSPLDGYKIYPPTVADVNALGKHLNEEKGQDDLLNRSILDILDKLSSLEGQNIDEDMEDLAVHAHNIRNNFFDSTKRLVDVIPEVLLRTEPNLDKDVQPRKRVPLERGRSRCPSSKRGP